MKAPGRTKWRKPAAGHSHPRGSNPNSPTPLRSTGIRVADAMPWGAHICLFYETKHDLLDTNSAYIKAGLDDNEYCVWAISQPITQEDAWAALRRDVPDLDGRIAANQLEILPGYSWYLKGGEVDSKKITSGWHEKLQSALDKGFDG